MACGRRLAQLHAIVMKCPCLISSTRPPERTCTWLITSATSELTEPARLSQQFSLLFMLVCSDLCGDHLAPSNVFVDGGIAIFSHPAVLKEGEVEVTEWCVLCIRSPAL